MADSQALLNILQTKFAPQIRDSILQVGELTIEIEAHNLLEVCRELRDHPDLQFEMLIDLAGVDYLQYGLSEWETTDATFTGFSRGVANLSVQSHCVTVSKGQAPTHASNENPLSEKSDPAAAKTNGTTPCWPKPRFAVVYHLLSLQYNHRLRLRTFAENDPPIVPSVINIWNSANWYEREAFDLYGILFEGHPDLRRILTDYGFIGHPFRKDFPLIGTMEMRYSAENHRVIYEPVSITPRTLVPKTIRDDNRYLIEQEFKTKEKQEDEKVLNERVTKNV